MNLKVGDIVLWNDREIAIVHRVNKGGWAILKSLEPVSNDITPWPVKISDLSSQYVIRPPLTPLEKVIYGV